MGTEEEGRCLRGVGRGLSQVNFEAGHLGESCCRDGSRGYKEEKERNMMPVYMCMCVSAGVCVCACICIQVKTKIGSIKRFFLNRIFFFRNANEFMLNFPPTPTPPTFSSCFNQWQEMTCYHGWQLKCSTILFFKNPFGSTGQAWITRTAGIPPHFNPHKRSMNRLKVHVHSKKQSPQSGSFQHFVSLIPSLHGFLIQMVYPLARIL